MDSSTYSFRCFCKSVSKGKGNESPGSPGGSAEWMGEEQSGGKECKEKRTAQEEGKRARVRIELVVKESLGASVDGWKGKEKFTGM